MSTYPEMEEHGNLFSGCAIESSNYVFEGPSEILKSLKTFDCMDLLGISKRKASTIWISLEASAQSIEGGNCKPFGLNDCYTHSDSLVGINVLDNFFIC
jgi:hypothetical protein